MSDKGPSMLISSWMLFGVTLGIVGITLYIRTKSTERKLDVGGHNLHSLPHSFVSKLQKLHLDDWTTMFSVLVFLITNILLTIGVQNGLGKSFESIPPAQQPAGVFWNLVLISTIIFNFSIPKFAFAACVDRTTAGSISQRFRWWSWVAWALCTLSLLFIVAVSVWEWRQCTPVSYQWNRIPGTGSCRSPSINIALAVSSSIFSTIVDIALVAWLVAVVWRLNAAIKKKLVFSSTLLGGLCACGISIWKIVLLFTGLKEIAMEPTRAAWLLYILVNAEAAALLVSARIAILLKWMLEAADNTQASGPNGRERLSSSTPWTNSSYGPKNAADQYPLERRESTNSLVGDSKTAQRVDEQDSTSEDWRSAR